MLPDVLVIVSDDQGYADVSWTGPIPTPNLARLKDESVTLDSFYVHPTCTPTRAALFTGMVAPHSTMTLGYRWNDWKLVQGQVGDPRRFREPLSDGEYIGDTFHDRVAELVMHWQHSWDEDASGTMDETVREVAVTVQEYWREVLGMIGGRVKKRAMLYDLKSDPYEDVDVAAQHPEVVRSESPPSS